MQTSPRRLCRIPAAVIVALAVLIGPAAPAAASAAAPAVVEIPGDYPLPEPGARVDVPVPAGGRVRLGPGIDATRLSPSLAGLDLELEVSDGGTLVLKGFFAPTDPPAALVIGGSTVPADVLLMQLAALGQEEEIPDVAAGPAAGGGGEMFGMLQVVSWLIERIDPLPAAEAVETQVAQAGEPAGFAQLAAQIRIARDEEIAGLAAGYQQGTARLLDQMKRWVEGGGGSEADYSFARGADLDAQIQEKDAEYQLALSIDAHQDAFGERLEHAAFPSWREPPPTDLTAIAAALPADRQAAARRNWRQARHARETVALLETLAAVADEVHAAYEQQFEVAQRSLGEVTGALRTAFQARVRLSERRAEQLVAEAWLLGALGNLPADAIKHPGWQ